MPGMEGQVAHTKEFTALDSALSADPRRFMGDYQSGRSFSTLLGEAERAGIIDAATARHIEEHWLGPWPQAGGVLIAGLYWACRLAAFVDGDESRPRSAPLRIASVWISDASRLELVSFATSLQVTLMFLTPGSVAPAQQVGNALQPIWATRPGSTAVEREQLVQVDVRTNTVTVRPRE